MSNSIVSFYRGKDENIQNLPKRDGALYFATNTKKIYLDYYQDELNRLSIGGSNGILYANKEFAPETSEYIFYLEDFENATMLPEIDDLILNLVDGCFYRVIQQDTSSNFVITSKLTVSGGGGGGSTNYVSGKIEKTNYYFGSDALNLPIKYTAYTTAEYAQLFVAIYIGAETTPRDTFNIESKKDMSDPHILDLYKYKSSFPINEKIQISLVLYDDLGNRRSTPLRCQVVLSEMSVLTQAPAGGWPTTTSAFSYKCYVKYSELLENIVLHCDLIETAYNSVVMSKTVVPTISPSQVSCDIDIQSPGAYIIKTWLEAKIPESEEYLRSNYLLESVIFQSEVSPTPILSATFPDEDIIYTQYQQNVTASYKVSYKIGEINYINRIIQFIPEGSVQPIEEIEPLRIDSETIYTWTLQFKKKGQYKFIIQLVTEGGALLNEISSGIYTVIASADIPEIQTNSLRLNFVADKTNNSLDYDSWVSNVKTIDGRYISAQLENFNWSSNGWQEIDGITSLHLTNKAKCIIDYSAFNSRWSIDGLTLEFDVKVSNIKDKDYYWLSYGTFDSKGQINNGIAVNGVLFTLNSLTKNPMKNEWEKIIDEETQEKQHFISDKTLTGLTARFLDGERITVSYVITPLRTQVDELTPKRMVCTYINGVLSGLTDYGDDENGFTDPSGSSSKIIFDSANADIDIYNIRYYNSVLNSRSILSNYLASNGNMELASQKWIDNSILNDNGSISLRKVIEKKQMPVLVIRGGHSCNKKGDLNSIDKTDIEKFTLPDGMQGEGKKKDFRAADIYFIDPTGKTPNIGSREHRIPVVLYPQGTSSLDYPVKNLRVNFKNNRNTTETKSYKLYNKDNYDCKIFTLKADYMDSSSAHNTGTGNALNALYDSVGLKTPAQVLNKDSLTAIVGFPFVIFFKGCSMAETYDDTIEDYDDYTYMGKYNWNIDKSEHIPFGFYNDTKTNYGLLIDQLIPIIDPTSGQYLTKEEYLNKLKQANPTAGFQATLDEELDESKIYYIKPVEKMEEAEIFTGDNEQFQAYLKQAPLYEYKEFRNAIQCWECLTNASQYTRFQIPWSEEIDAKVEVDETIEYYPKWTEAFESRYPEYATEQATDKRALARVVNWLASTNCMDVWDIDDELAKNVYTEEDTPEGYKPIYPDPANPILPLKEQGVVKTYSGYVYDCPGYRKLKFKTEFTTYFNFDFCLFYYLITETLLMIDSRAKNMMLCSFDADADKNIGHWFPIFYDMDTMLGIDNEGKVRFRYDEEGNYNGIYNASSGYVDQYGTKVSYYSVLWANFAEVFDQEISSFYNKLRSSNVLSSNKLDEIYNTNLADAWNETYLNEDYYFKYIQPYIKDNNDRLYAAQGTRSQHRARFIRDRLQYFDSKYFYTTDNHQVTMRIWEPDSNYKEYFKDKLTRYTVTADDSLYFYYGFTNGDLSKRLLIREGKTITTPYLERSFATEQEAYIYFIDNIKEISSFDSKHPAAIAFDGNENSLIKWRTFDLSNNWPEYYKTFQKNATKLAQLTLLQKLPYLEKVIVSYLGEHASISVLPLENCKYLETIQAFGTPSITSINFPVGGVLETVQLPPSLVSIDIKGQNLLEQFEVEDKETLNPFKNTLASLSVIECKKLNTKQIIEELQENCMINLPDINWVLEPEDLIIDSNIVSKIPILEKLLDLNGTEQRPAKKDGEYVLGRTYVGGNITINNGIEIGIDEALLYKKYIKYYPNINIKYTPNDLSIPAYTFDVYDIAGRRNALYSKKFSAADLSTEFTMEAIFEKNGEIIMPPAVRDSSTQYVYKFRGWTRNSSHTIFYEVKNVTSLEEAIIECDNNLIIKYENNHYSTINDFKFDSYYNVDQKELSIYPAFVAELRKYEVQFIDTATDKEIGETQLVKYGYKAVLPIIEPRKIEYDEDDLSKAVIYPFINYIGSDINHTDATELIIRTNIIFSTNYSPVAIDARLVPSDNSYFELNGNTLILKPVENEKLIVVPTSMNDVTINTIEISLNNQFANNIVERIYFQPTNAIEKIIFKEGIASTFPELCYFDFQILNNLTTINSDNNKYAFGNTKLKNISLPDSLGAIPKNCFCHCELLEKVIIGSSCIEIGDNAFSQCSNLSQMDLTKAILINIIGANAFEGNKQMKFVNNILPFNNLQGINNSAFKNCNNLILNLDFENYKQLQEIGVQGFFGCSNVTISFPETLYVNQLNIGNYAFQSNGEIGISHIPNNVIIGLMAFRSRNFTNANILKINCSKDILSNWSEEALYGTNNINTIQVLNDECKQIAINTNGWGSNAIIIKENE